MALSSLNSIGQTVFELESGNKNVDGQLDGQTDGQTDGQMDIGHINLIGGLVTCNLPKKYQSMTCILHIIMNNLVVVLLKSSKY